MLSKKRGQVTLFVILGILLLAAITAVTYFKGSAVKEKILGTTKASVYPENVQIVREVLEDCYLFTAHEAVKLLGLQGGYIFPLEKSSMEIDGNLINLAYDKTLNVPTTDIMAQELQEYMDIMFPLCPDYEAFEDLNIEAGEPKTKVTINNDKVNLETTYMLQLISGQDTFQVSEPYTATSTTRLNTLQELEKKIAEESAKKPGIIDPELLLTFGLPIDIVPYDENTAIYIVRDPESQLPIEEEEFTYIFATRK